MQNTPAYTVAGISVTLTVLLLAVLVVMWRTGRITGFAAFIAITLGVTMAGTTWGATAVGIVSTATTSGTTIVNGLVNH